MKFSKEKNRQRNAYNFFVKRNFRLFQSHFNVRKISDTLHELGKCWKTLNEDEKNLYQDQLMPITRLPIVECRTTSDHSRPKHSIKRKRKSIKNSQSETITQTDCNSRIEIFTEDFLQLCREREHYKRFLKHEKADLIHRLELIKKFASNDLLKFVREDIQTINNACLAIKEWQNNSEISIKEGLSKFNRSCYQKMSLIQIVESLEDNSSPKVKQVLKQVLMQ